MVTSHLKQLNVQNIDRGKIQNGERSKPNEKLAEHGHR